MILDTSFVVDVIQGEEAAVAKARQIENQHIAEKLAAVTLFELHTEIMRCDKPEKEKKEVLEVINSKEVVEADQEIMKQAGRLHGRLIKQGKRIGSFDCMIAATAISLGETLLTRNETDFERIEFLAWEMY